MRTYDNEWTRSCLIVNTVDGHTSSVRVDVTVRIAHRFRFLSHYFDDEAVWFGCDKRSLAWTPLDAMRLQIQYDARLFASGRYEVLRFGMAQ